MKKLCFLLFLQSALFVSAQYECPTEVHSGTATIYTNGLDGSCTFLSGEVPVNYCAVNTTDYATASLCGSCLEITGAAGTTTVYVVSDYPGAAAGWLDLSPTAFEEAIGPQSQGTGNVSWRVINCPYFDATPIEVSNVGSNPWFVSFVIHKHINPIESVEIFVGGNWEQLTRKDYNAWESTGLTINNETVLDARVTDIFGQQVLVNDIDMTNTSQAYLGVGNFAPCSAADLTETEQVDLKILQGPQSVLLQYDEQPIRISLTDLQGKEIKANILQNSSTFTEISTSELPNGVYSITIDFESKGRVSRMVRF